MLPTGPYVLAGTLCACHVAYTIRSYVQYRSSLPDLRRIGSRCHKYPAMHQTLGQGCDNHREAMLNRHSKTRRRRTIAALKLGCSVVNSTRHGQPGVPGVRAPDSTASLCS